jgi:hypothetical protein
MIIYYRGGILGMLPRILPKLDKSNIAYFESNVKQKINFVRITLEHIRVTPAISSY